MSICLKRPNVSSSFFFEMRISSFSNAIRNIRILTGRPHESAFLAHVAAALLEIVSVWAIGCRVKSLRENARERDSYS
jgi:hypothetical protein